MNTNMNGRKIDCLVYKNEEGKQKHLQTNMPSEPTYVDSLHLSATHHGTHDLFMVVCKYQSVESWFTMNDVVRIDFSLELK